MSRRKGDSAVRKAAQAIAALKRIVLVSHYNPDADAYGSMCGLGLALKKSGREVFFVNESGRLPHFAFIPGVEAVENKFPDAQYDGVIVCDCGEVSRIGETLIPAVKAAKTVVNIDHHSSNDGFGTVNLVDCEASSTAELVHGVLKEMGIEIDAAVAKCLFAGLSADTGSFQFSCTTAGTFAVAEELIRCGASAPEIARELYSTVSLSALRIHAQALLNVELWCGGKAALVLVTDEMYRACGANSTDAEGLAEKARNIQGVLVAVSVRRDSDIWRVSMRSLDSSYDVSSVAEKFGGGGHKPAAAFRWRKALDELLAKLKEEVTQLIEQHEGIHG